MYVINISNGYRGRKRGKSDIDVFIDNYINSFRDQINDETNILIFIEDFVNRLSVISINKIIKHHCTFEIYNKLIEHYIKIYDKIEYIDGRFKYIVEGYDDDNIKKNVVKLILKNIINSTDIQL